MAASARVVPLEMAAPQSIFAVTLRRNIWRVTLDGVFCGDFRSRDHALSSIQDARRDFAQIGRTAKISSWPPTIPEQGRLHAVETVRDSKKSVSWSSIWPGFADSPEIWIIDACRMRSSFTD
jgi:hypothetical protein